MERFSAQEIENIKALVSEDPESFILWVKELSSQGKITVTEHEIKKSLRAHDIPFDESKLRDSNSRFARSRKVYRNRKRRNNR